MSLAVIACSSCQWSWIVEAIDSHQTTECSRCGTQFNTNSRRHLYQTDDPEQAAEIRGAILAQRADQDDDYETVPHFADLSDLATQGVIDDAALLDALGVELPDQDDNAPQSSSENTARPLVEGPDVDVDIVEQPLLAASDADQPDFDNQFTLEPYPATLPADASIHRDVGPQRSNWLPKVLNALQPTAARLVEELAAEYAPQAQDGYNISLFVREVLMDQVAAVPDDSPARVHAEVQAYFEAVTQYALQFAREDYLKDRVEIGDDLVSEVKDVLTSVGTGRGPWNADLDAFRYGPVVLHQQAVRPPTHVFILDGEEWTDAATDTIERALEAFHALAQGIDVQLYASPTTARTIQRAADRAQSRDEPTPAWATDLTRTGDTFRLEPATDQRNDATRQADAWGLLIDGAHKDGHRDLLQNLHAEDARTVQDLKHDAALDYRNSTIDGYLGELEDNELIAVDRSTTASNEIRLTPLGAIARALVADDGSVHHPRQSRLDAEAYENPPASHKCSVAPQTDKRGSVEAHLAATGNPDDDGGWVQWLGDAGGDRRLQPPVLQERILAGRRVRGVNLVEDSILDWTNDGQAPDGDGRVTYLSAFNDDVVAVTQWGGSAATLARLATALLSDPALSKILAPSNMGVQFEQLFNGADRFEKDLENVLQRGAQVGWLSEEELDHIDKWRDRVRAVRSEVLSKLADLDDLDQELRSQWFRDVQGLLTSAISLYRAAGLHVNINLRVPNGRELARDEDRLQDFTQFLRHTVTKQAGFEGENGWHSIFRMLMEDRPEKLRARLPYEVKAGEESAELTASWILQGRGIEGLQEKIKTALAAEGDRVRDQVQDGGEDAAVLDIPVVCASTEAYTRRLIQRYAEQKGFAGADVDQLTRVLSAFMTDDDQSRGPVPMDVADVMMSLESKDGRRDRLDPESLAVGLSNLPVEKLLPELPPSATRMLQALLAAESSLTRQELIELTSENSVGRHLEKLLATDLVEHAGPSEFIGVVVPWWSPNTDLQEPREEVHTSAVDGGPVLDLAVVLFEVLQAEAGDVMAAHDWQLLSHPIDIEEIAAAFPDWEWFIRYVDRLAGREAKEDEIKRVIIGHSPKDRNSTQMSLPSDAGDCS
jgi:hypothetical protein